MTAEAEAWTVYTWLGEEVPVPPRPRFRVVREDEEYI